jgi:hypothetical protein
VPEHLLDNADVDALLDQHRARGVPSVVDAYLSHAGPLEDDLPLAPVHSVLHWGTVLGGEHEVVIVPELAGLGSFSLLDLPMPPLAALGPHLGECREPKRSTSEHVSSLEPAERGP